MTNDNDGWTRPAQPREDKQPNTLSGWNYAIQSMNAQTQMREAEAKLAADGWTQTVPGEWESPALPSSNPTGTGWGPSHVSAQPAPALDGWTTPAPAPKTPPAAELPHAWTKPPEVRPRDELWPNDRGNGSRYYVGYQTAALYCVLAGPYDTIEEAQARDDVAFARMQADSTMEFVFGKLDAKNITTLVLPLVKVMRTGAYGRL